MADSIAVFPPGWYVFDSNGDPVSNATIEFYDAGTSNAKTVYSDDDLTQALGTIVYTDAAGAPVAASGASTRVAVYTGTAAYKVIIKDSSGSEIETKDNLSGAVDTSGFAAGSEALPTYPVESKSVDYTVVAGDQAKIINVNPTTATRTITLPSAVTVGDNWSVTIRHVGTANKVQIETVSSQTVSLPLNGAPLTAFELTGYADSVTLVSDGSSWHVPHEVNSQKLGRGYYYDTEDLGTGSGTITPDPRDSNLMQLTNNAAFTLAPPTVGNCRVDIMVTNGASAGAVTTSGFTHVDGSFTTTNGHDFLCRITVINSLSHLEIIAMQ